MYFTQFLFLLVFIKKIKKNTKPSSCSRSAKAIFNFAFIYTAQRATQPRISYVLCVVFSMRAHRTPVCIYISLLLLLLQRILALVPFCTYTKHSIQKTSWRLLIFGRNMRILLTSFFKCQNSRKTVCVCARCLGLLDVCMGNRSARTAVYRFLIICVPFILEPKTNVNCKKSELVPVDLSQAVVAYASEMPMQCSSFHSALVLVRYRRMCAKKMHNKYFIDVHFDQKNSLQNKCTYSLNKKMFH